MQIFVIWNVSPPEFLDLFSDSGLTLDKYYWMVSCSAFQSKFHLLQTHGIFIVFLFYFFVTLYPPPNPIPFHYLKPQIDLQPGFV